MGIMGPKPGTLWLRSVKDSEFNTTWRVDHCSIFSANEEAEKKVKEMEEGLGRGRPSDLEYGFMKD